MYRAHIHALPLAGVLLLTACAHKPVDLVNCDLPMQRLTLAEPQSPQNAATGPAAAPGAASAPASGYEAMIAAALAPPLAPSAAPGPPGSVSAAPPPIALFLSGGSQNGAFGAGFVDEWRVGGGGRLPDFRIVTGISTGALIEIGRAHV